MDRIQALSGTQHHSEKFKYDGVEWALETQWGEAILHRLDKKEYYGFDLEASSVFSLSLAVMAIKGENKESAIIKYTLSSVISESKYVMQIKSPLEEYTYIFRKREVDQIQFLVEELEKIKMKFTKLNGKMPIVGLLRPKLWKEFSLHDFVSVFDYSFLNLKKKPLIFTNIEGRCGYSAIHEITNTSCKVYIHWNNLMTLPPVDKMTLQGVDDVWKLAYCIFPQEDAVQEEEKVHLSELKMEEELSTYEGVDEAIKKGRKLIIYEDKVIDVASFFDRHPGSETPLKHLIGKEVGRYVYGAFSTSGLHHKHSPLAIDLMKKYTVGVIKSSLAGDTFGTLPEGRTQDSYIWKLESIEGLTDIHMIGKFTNPQLDVSPQISNISAFGHYITLTSVDSKISRNYALVYFIEEGITKAHMQMLKSFEEKGDFHAPYESLEDIKFKHLPLAFKRKQDFSAWLADKAPPGTTFKICGPWGRGLAIPPNAKGKYVAVTAGTGALLFVDLVAYLFRMNTYRAGKADGKEYKVFGNEEFTDLTDPSFKFTLICSFRSLKEAAFGAFLQKAHKVAQTSATPNFEIIIRQSVETPEHWGKEFYQDKVPTDAEKIYVIGSEEFIASATENLKVTGHDPAKLHYI